MLATDGGPGSVPVAETPEASDSYVWSLGFALAIVFHVAVTTTYSTALRWSEHAATTGEGVAVAVLWFLVAVFIRVLWARRSDAVASRRPWKALTRTWPWIVATLAAFTTIATGTALHEWLFTRLVNEHVSTAAYVVGAVMLCAAVGFSALLFEYRHSFGAHARYPRSAPAEQRRCLVLFVSDLNLKRVGRCDKGIPEWHTLATGMLVDEFIKLAADKAEYHLKHKEWPKNWPWEMSLHAIAHHVGVVETVALVCSPESLADVDHLNTIIATFADTKFLADKTIVWCRSASKRKAYGTREELLDANLSPTGFELEHLDDLSDAIHSLLRHLHSIGFEDDDIMLDFTSGQKTNSIVCACATFNGALRAQYMKTSDPSIALSYDLSVDSERSPVGG